MFALMKLLQLAFTSKCLFSFLRRRAARAKIVNMSALGGPDETDVPSLRYLGDERLMQRQRDATVEEIESDEFQSCLRMLPAAMRRHGGIGIAGPQVGWWARVFCFGIDGSNPRYPNADGLPLRVYINPAITWSSEETNWMWEGCLSVPGMRGWVERPREVRMTSLDERGTAREEEHLTGLAARIAQHELDHLDGVLFPRRVPSRDYLVPQASIEQRGSWAEGWPSPGSYKTMLGDLCDER